MTGKTPKELLDRNLITPEQFAKIDLISSGKFISLYFELRTVLYLGVLLFTTGSGILIYQNIDDAGHVISIIALSLLMVSCISYAFIKATPFSKMQVTSPNAYLDYVLLVGALLFVSIQGYIQLQFEIFSDYLEFNTLFTAACFFYLAYRFDHLGILSLAIAAFASFWGLSFSTQHWYRVSFLNEDNLYVTAILFSVFLGAVALYLNIKSIKKHFTFTYLNFCFLFLFSGSLIGTLEHNAFEGLYCLLTFVACGFAWQQAQKNKSYLFLIYAFVFGYITLTYLLGEYIFNSEPFLWSFYFIVSCGSLVYLIIRFRNYFKR